MGGEKIFTYLERHGVSRDDSVLPRNLREDVGGDKQQLVLATFADEVAADHAARALRNSRTRTGTSRCKSSASYRNCYLQGPNKQPCDH
jgi:hypothetical protein